MQFPSLLTAWGSLYYKCDRIVNDNPFVSLLLKVKCCKFEGCGPKSHLRQKEFFHFKDEDVDPIKDLRHQLGQHDQRHQRVHQDAPLQSGFGLCTAKQNKNLCECQIIIMGLSYFNACPKLCIKIKF